MKIVVTGGAGFIGSHLINDLLADGLDVIGLDNFNDYYDPELKHARVEYFQLPIEKVDMTDFDALDTFFNEYKPDIVIHLALVRVYVILLVKRLYIIETILKQLKI